MSGFEKKCHFAIVIFEHTPVFKWPLVGQILLKLNEIFCIYLIILLAVCQILKPWDQIWINASKLKTCVSSKITCAK